MTGGAGNDAYVVDDLDDKVLEASNGGIDVIFSLISLDLSIKGANVEDLVRAGKVRYIGVSDTPAWKVVEANMTAHVRGWAAFIGLQIEYSLLERSVEQELVPMARQFGLGITPWSPLKSGVLSGKYTRATVGQVKADRGPFLEPFLNEKTFIVVEALEVIASAHDSTVARIALAWVQAQPGVSGQHRADRLRPGVLARLWTRATVDHDRDARALVLEDAEILQRVAVDDQEVGERSRGDDAQLPRAPEELRL